MRECEKVRKLQPRVDLRKLKAFALDALPKEHPLRDVLLIERDEVTANEFLAKLPIWLKLADMAGYAQVYASQEQKTVHKMLKYA